MELSIRNRTDLKSYFVKNAIPTESNFADFIDAVLNQKDDGIAKLPGNPLSIEALGDDRTQKKALNFYRSFEDDKPSWVISLNPRSDPARPETARPGFNISDGEGNNRLFIDRSTGHIGVGTTDPGSYKLSIGKTGGQNALHLASDFGLYGDNKLNLIKFGNEGDYQILHKSAGAFGRNTLAMHVHQNDAFGVYSTGWRPLMEVKGGSGDLYVRGSMGINTTGPTESLDVNGRMKAGGLTIGPWPANPANYVFFGTNVLNQASAGNYALLQDTSGADKGRTYLNSPVDIRFRIANVDKMVLTNAGNLGIQRTNPSVALDVNGTIKANAIRTRLFTNGGTATRALSKTNKWATFPDLSRTFSVSDQTNVLVFYQVTMPGGNSHLVTRLVVDNQVQIHSRAITGNTTYWSPSNVWIGTLAKGSHTITVQYRTPVGGTNTPAHDWQNRVLKILIFGS